MRPDSQYQAGAGARVILAGTSGDLALTARPRNPFFGFGGGLRRDTFTGRDVRPEDSLALSYVIGAVNLISNLGGMMPLEVIDERNNKREVVRDAEIARTIAHAPNDEMSGVDLWQLVLAHLCLRGNAYLAKLPNADRPLYGELFPLAPETVTPFRGENGKKLFAVQCYTPGSRTAVEYYDESLILHIKGPSYTTGISGASPIALMRNRVGVHLAQSEYQARFYQQGYQLKGVLSTDAGNLTPEAAQRMKDQWRATYSGMDNSHDVAILHSGLKFQPISISPEDAQFIETMRWGATEVATAFNIPASRLNGEASSLTYANSAQDDLVLYKQAILPRLRMVESALNADRNLFGSISPWTPQFNADSVLRADIEQRYRAYEIGKRNGWLTANEIRRSEQLPPVKGGDDLSQYAPRGTTIQEAGAQRSAHRSGREVIAPEVRVQMPDIPAPQVTVNVPEQPAPVVNVDAPVVNVPEQPAPVVNVDAPVVNVPAPVVKVDAPVVKFDPEIVVQPSPPRNITFARNHTGQITGLEVNDG